MGQRPTGPSTCELHLSVLITGFPDPDIWSSGRRTTPPGPIVLEGMTLMKVSNSLDPSPLRDEGPPPLPGVPGKFEG